MSKSPWKVKRRRGSDIDWPVMIVTGCIVVMGAVLVGSVLSSYVYGPDQTDATTSLNLGVTPKMTGRAR